MAFVDLINLQTTMTDMKTKMAVLSQLFINCNAISEILKYFMKNCFFILINIDVMCPHIFRGNVFLKMKLCIKFQQSHFLVYFENKDKRTMTFWKFKTLCYDLYWLDLRSKSSWKWWTSKMKLCIKFQQSHFLVYFENKDKRTMTFWKFKTLCYDLYWLDLLSKSSWKWWTIFWSFQTLNFNMSGKLELV